MHSTSNIYSSIKTISLGLSDNQLKLSSPIHLEVGIVDFTNLQTDVVTTWRSLIYAPTTFVELEYSTPFGTYKFTVSCEKAIERCSLKQLEDEIAEKQEELRIRKETM